MPPTLLSFPERACLAVARVWPLGLSPVMPGTVCSAASALAAPYVFLPLGMGARCALLALLFIFGSLLAGKAARILGLEDPSELVIDEMLGMWLVLAPFKEPSPALICAAFVFFRFFDILKPWPVSASEHWLPGGFGIMLDDVVAGLCALVCVSILHAANLI